MGWIYHIVAPIVERRYPTSRRRARLGKVKPEVHRSFVTFEGHRMEVDTEWAYKQYEAGNYQILTVTTVNGEIQTFFLKLR